MRLIAFFENSPQKWRSKTESKPILKYVMNKYSQIDKERLISLYIVSHSKTPVHK